MKFLKTSHPYALTTIIFWSLAYVLTRLTLQYFSPMALGFLRYFIASLTLIVIGIFRKTPLPKARDILWFVVAGLTGFTIYVVAFNTGTTYVTAATSAVVIAASPIFTALLAFIFLGEKLRGRQWISIGISFVGILILTLWNGELSINIGILYLLAAALVFSVYNLILRRLSKTYTALQNTIFSIVAGTFFLTVFAPQAVGEMQGVPSIQLVYIAIMGIFSSALAFITWSKAVEKAETTASVSNYMFITPFFTAILGFFMAGEVPEASTWIGGAFIILGAFLFNQSKGDTTIDTPINELSEDQCDPGFPHIDELLRTESGVKNEKS